MKLNPRYVEKPWGRTTLPPGFDNPADKRIGEVWFANDADLPLLAKYIFTSDRLSIQVHPDDEQAHRRGLARGKTECWYILEADPSATIGLGLKRKLKCQELRQAALDGSIETLLDWRPVRPGDFFFVPAGTIHAIGAGISLIEFQQNADATYRLYDYGRPRELHLEDALTVAHRGPYPSDLAQHVAPSEQCVLSDKPPFTFVHTRTDALRERRRWVIPLEGRVQSGDDVVGAGECLLVEAGNPLISDAARMLIGANA